MTNVKRREGMEAWRCIVGGAKSHVAWTWLDATGCESRDLERGEHSGTSRTRAFRLAGTLDDEMRHHAGFVMLEDVAVIHPLAGPVIG